MRRVIYLRRPHVGRDEQGLQQQLERGFQRQWGQPASVLVLMRAREVWQPPADVYETAGSLVVRVELPGMRDAEIEVTLDERALRISGRRPEQRDPRVTAYHQMGINSGAFALEVFLAQPFDAERVSASYDDGFLTVELPKPV
ncbi:MAG: hypothetical protein OHK0022_23560 [Roseiflexaceae bacterium]